MKLDGTLTGVAFGTPGNAAVAALTFDGTYLWALVPSKGAIYQIDIGNGEPLPPPPPQATPTPDNSFTYTINTLFDDNAFTELIDTDNAVFNPEGSISYWCPAVRDGEVTGTVTYLIELPLVIETASLTAAGAVFWGEGELTVEVSPDGGSYHEVYTLARGGGDAVSDNQEHDITASVAGSSTVYVRARMRAWSSYCSQFLRNGSAANPVLSLRGSASAPAPVAADRPPLIESGDYDGDGDAEIAVFRESNGLWSIQGVTRVYFGGEGDVPVSGDYNGDGTAEIALFRPENGLWVFNDARRVYFGGPGDIPVPGDYNNDGRCDIALFRESMGLWAISGVSRVYFGGPGDRPVPADYTKDGGCDIALFRDDLGRWAIRGHSRIYFGAPGDTSVPAPYYPNVNRSLCAVFRASTGLWSIRGVSRFYFGGGSDRPVPGDYTRAGCSQPAVFDGDSGRWVIRGVSRFYFGSAGDIPVTR